MLLLFPVYKTHGFRVIEKESFNNFIKLPETILYPYIHTYYTTYTNFLKKKRIIKKLNRTITIITTFISISVPLSILCPISPFRHKTNTRTPESSKITISFNNRNRWIKHRKHVQKYYN